MDVAVIAVREIAVHQMLRYHCTTSLGHALRLK